jgi:hypothetical protein
MKVTNVMNLIVVETIIYWKGMGLEGNDWTHIAKWKLYKDNYHRLDKVHTKNACMKNVTASMYVEISSSFRTVF